jgi:hypothetical protein
MAKIWFVVIMVYGNVVETSPVAMTAEQCALQAAYTIMQVEQYARSGKPVPEKYGGGDVTLADVHVACKRGTE